MTANREPKATYGLFAAEFPPVVIGNARAALRPSAAGQVEVTAQIQARGDFPAYSIIGYGVRSQILNAAGEVLATQTESLPLLHPGAGQAFAATFDLAATARPVRVRIEVVRPTGFVIATADPSGRRGRKALTDAGRHWAGVRGHSRGGPPGLED